MQHQILGADLRRAIQLASKRHDGFLAHHRIERRQIHQVIRMDHQRVQIELRPQRLESLHIVRIRYARAPHPRARREDLEVVRPQLCRLQRRVLQRIRPRCMDADPQKRHRSRRYSRARVYYAAYWIIPRTVVPSPV